MLYSYGRVKNLVFLENFRGLYDYFVRVLIKLDLLVKLEYFFKFLF